MTTTLQRLHWLSRPAAAIRENAFDWIEILILVVTVWGGILAMVMR